MKQIKNRFAKILTTILLFGLGSWSFATGHVQKYSYDTLKVGDRYSASVGVPSASEEDESYTVVSLEYEPNKESDIQDGAPWELELALYVLQYEQEKIGFPTIFRDTLKVVFDPEGRSVYKQAFKVDGYAASVLVKGISTTGDVPGNVFFKMESVKESTVRVNSVPDVELNINSNTEVVSVFWTYIEKADQYELQWVFIDQYDRLKPSGSLGDAIDSSDVDPAFAFSYKEPVSVLLNEQNFEILSTYPKGRLYCRVRAIGEFLETNHKTFQYGDWGYPDDGVSTSSTTDAYTNSTFQSVHSFAENGKNKKVVSYVDGSSRVRQTLSQLNTIDQLIAGETMYDHEGRGVLSALPHPVLKPTSSPVLAFQSNQNKFKLPNGSLSDSKLCFDTVGNSLPFSDSSGVGEYYSDKSSTDWAFRNRLPDAQGYAYSLTKFSRDGMGQVVAIGAPGESLAISDSNHYSKIFYAGATDTELRRLFGSNIGDASHFSKVVTQDPNGQVSVAYVDQAGKTWATALAGLAPDNVIQLDNNDFFQDDITLNLQDSNFVDQNELVSWSSSSIMNTTPNTEYEFTYDVTIPRNIFDVCSHLELTQKEDMTFRGKYFTKEIITDEAIEGKIFTNGIGDTLENVTASWILDRRHWREHWKDELHDLHPFYDEYATCTASDNFCEDCKYRLEVTILDPNDQGITTIDTTAGDSTNNGVLYKNYPTTPESSCDSNSIHENAITFKATFDQVGTYTITKRLIVVEPFDSLLSYSKTEIPKGFPQIDSLIARYKAEIDYSGCDVTCEEQCASIVAAENLANDITMTEDEFDQAVMTCVAEDCNQDSLGFEAILGECEGLYSGMKQQMSPGGYHYENQSAYVFTDAAVSALNLELDGTGFADSADVLNSGVFREEWANDLVTIHPEYDFYEICYEAVPYKAYDKAMYAVGSWEEAIESGFINPGSMDTTEGYPNWLDSLGTAVIEDPYIDDNASNYSNSNVINAPVSEYLDTAQYYGSLRERLGVTLSAFPAQRGATENWDDQIRDTLAFFADTSFVPQSWIDKYDRDNDNDLDLWEFVLVHDLYGHSPSSQEKWNMFRSLYSGLKWQAELDIIYHNHDASCDIDGLDQSCSPYLEDAHPADGEAALVQKPLQKMTLEEIEDEVFGGVSNICLENSVYGADAIIGQMEASCFKLVDNQVVVIDSVTLESIRPHIETYLFDSCGISNFFGTILLEDVGLNGDLQIVDNWLDTAGFGCTVSDYSVEREVLLNSNCENQSIVKIGPGSQLITDMIFYAYEVGRHVNLEFPENEYEQNLRKRIELLDWRVNMGGTTDSLLIFSEFWADSDTSIVSLRKSNSYPSGSSWGNLVRFTDVTIDDFSHVSCFWGTHDIQALTRKNELLDPDLASLRRGTLPIESCEDSTCLRLLASSCGCINDVISFMAEEDSVGDNKFVDASSNPIWTLNADHAEAAENLRNLFNEGHWVISKTSTDEVVFDDSTSDAQFYTRGTETPWTTTGEYSSSTIADTVRGMKWYSSGDQYKAGVAASGTPFGTAPSLILDMSNNIVKADSIAEITLITDNYSDSTEEYKICYIKKPSGNILKGKIYWSAPRYEAVDKLRDCYKHGYRKIELHNDLMTVQSLTGDTFSLVFVYEGQRIEMNDVIAAFGVFEDTTEDSLGLTGYTYAGSRVELIYDNGSEIDSVEAWIYTNSALAATESFFRPCVLGQDGISLQDEKEVCQYDLALKAEYKAQEEYEKQKERYLEDVREISINNCLGELLEEEFTVSYTNAEYHYTLFYHDQAGDLVRTVPPEGVIPLISTDFDSKGNWLGEDANGNYVSGHEPEHNMPTTYRYNSLGQLTMKSTPDGGDSYFWYDDLGRVRLSQDARQNAEYSEDSSYSYAIYDELGRTVEAGELHGFGSNLRDAGVSASVKSLLNDATNFPDDSYVKTEVNKTYYNEATSNYLFNGENLRNRVAEVVSNVGEDGENGTMYSYDIHGNVKSVYQKLPYFLYKKTDYTYDLISGNVLEVAYQKGHPDQFYHRYEYDADNRLLEVKTSTNGLLWDRDASYQYFAHGPLARVVLGQDNVQDLDYTYTLNGWLKGVNIPDVTVDGKVGSDYTEHNSEIVGQDEFGYVLGYFNGDYKSISSSSLLKAGKNSALFDGSIVGQGLYNGNIASIVAMQPHWANVTGASYDNSVLMRSDYQYDQLNRLKEAETYHAYSDGAGWSSTGQHRYNSSYNYDGNGNLMELERYADAGIIQDSLTYHYGTGKTIYGSFDRNTSNQLDYVDDVYDWSGSETDLIDQSPNNYSYDEIGNLVKNQSDKIEEITWTVTGKVKEVKFTGDTNNLEFFYNASGERIMKRIKPNPDSTQYWRNYIYSRDASGNELASYIVDSTTIGLGFEQILQDRTIYGSSRLGSRKDDKLIAVLVPDGYFIDWAEEEVPIPESDRGVKHYELKDHLGNVRVVIEDRKYSVWNDVTTEFDYYKTEVVQLNNYYPFGSEIQRKTWSKNLNQNSRFGFNGAEKVDEIAGSGSHYDFGARVYDSRIGRWMSADRLEGVYSFQSTYSFVACNPIVAIDVDGDGYEITIFSPYVGAMIAQEIEKNGEIDWEVFQGMYENMKQTFTKEEAEWVRDKLPSTMTLSNTLSTQALEVNTDVDMVKVNFIDGDGNEQTVVFHLPGQTSNYVQPESRMNWFEAFLHTVTPDWMKDFDKAKTREATSLEKWIFKHTNQNAILKAIDGWGTGATFPTLPEADGGNMPHELTGLEKDWHGTGEESTVHDEKLESNVTVTKSKKEWVTRHVGGYRQIDSSATQVITENKETGTRDTTYENKEIY